MNFTITIKNAFGTKTIDMQDAVVTIKPNGTTDSVKIRCIVRPDLWLDVRSNIESEHGTELGYAQILSSDPVKDPNHWLNRPDEEVGKYVKLKPKSQAVRNRRHRTRG